MDELEVGLYDKLVSRRMNSLLPDLELARLAADLAEVDPAEMPDRLGELVSSWVRGALQTVPMDERNQTGQELTLALFEAIDSTIADAVDSDELLAEPVQRLTAIEPLSPVNKPISIDSPLTPLRDTVLMTNARDQPTVGSEILAEVDSADRIDLILAFIRWTGIRPLLPALTRHVAAGRQLRVITTTYTGSTEQRALEALMNLGASVKVSYDTSTTRLHAKAWLFHRNTGFSTVYIGSSNLTFSAQISGLEWNVRASQSLNPDLVTSFTRAFDTYWADSHFEPFDSERFQHATASSKSDDSTITQFEIEPFPFQRQILERLQVERKKGHPHNLIAAATGTGKTIMAALDYRHLRTELPRSRLLFVAHRAEILEQSRDTFRHVLRDGSFGELWVDGKRPEKWEHVFASVQSLSASDLDNINPEDFDVVIVDEFHHAAAATYEKLLDHLKPRHLVGLTATPERTDGLDILRWFGGRIAIELRLWDALEQGLLSPFHYFGIHDGTDLSDVGWRRGQGYDRNELTGIYTADNFWVSKVLQTLEDKVSDPSTMRALGFCVSIAHAEFLADRFQKAGVHARAVTSSTNSEDRRQALTDLRDGKVQILFTVDLFNEGVDIPTVDVVLMLRPTESATIFLQQLGRGLRQSATKDVLTVLDFVGHQRREFRFDLRFRAMLGRSRRELENDVLQNFRYLPAGCHVELDEVAKSIVLRNIKESLPTGAKQREAELRKLGDISFGEFLEETGLELADIYRGGGSWTKLRRATGFITSSQSEAEESIGRGIGRILHIDDQERIDTYKRLVASPEPPHTASMSEHDRRSLEGLLLTVLSPKKATFADLQDAAEAFWTHSELRSELISVLDLLQDNIVHLHQPLRGIESVPIQLHATYNREEILGRFGASTVGSPLPLQTGVHFVESAQTDLLFITLKKNEKGYSPTTRYLDYAISDTLFHWESQASTRSTSTRGLNYIKHAELGRRIALFIREAKTDSNGQTLGYFSVGTAQYVSHVSERPMQITWKLDNRLPGDVFARYRAAVA